MGAQDFVDELRRECFGLDENTFFIGNENGCGFIEAFVKDDNTLTLEKVWVVSKLRKQGHGSNVMKCLTHYADVFGFDIELLAAEIKAGGGFIMNSKTRMVSASADKKNRISPKRLPKWYNKFGFEFINKNQQGNWNMKYFSKKFL